MSKKVVGIVLVACVLAVAPAQAGTTWTTRADGTSFNPQYGPSVSLSVEMNKPAAARIRVKSSRSGSVHASLDVTCYKANLDSVHKSKSVNVSVSGGVWKPVAFPTMPSGSFVYCHLDALASATFFDRATLRVQLQRR